MNKKDIETVASLLLFILAGIQYVFFVSRLAVSSAHNTRKECSLSCTLHLLFREFLSEKTSFEKWWSKMKLPK